MLLLNVRLQLQLLRLHTLDQCLRELRHLGQLCLHYNILALRLLSRLLQFLDLRLFPLQLFLQRTDLFGTLL